MSDKSFEELCKEPKIASSLELRNAALVSLINTSQMITELPHDPLKHRQFSILEKQANEALVEVKTTQAALVRPVVAPVVARLTFRMKIGKNGKALHTF